MNELCYQQVLNVYHNPEFQGYADQGLLYDFYHGRKTCNRYKRYWDEACSYTRSQTSDFVADECKLRW